MLLILKKNIPRLIYERLIWQKSLMIWEVHEPEGGGKQKKTVPPSERPAPL